MISINASYTNLVNQRTLATNTKNLHKATERLSTGMKINHANDDAAGLFVGSALASSISSRKIALDNTMLASNFLNIADGALSNVSANLNRMNELAIQACNDFMSTQAREALQAELDQMKANITQTIGKADMNGVATVKKVGMSAALIKNVNVKSEDYLIEKEGYVECTETNLDKAENTQFYINSAEQLQALATFTNDGGATTGRTFTLSADIDLSSVCSEESGVSWAGIGKWVSNSDVSKYFKGTFDGNGHTVSNLYIDENNKGSGLFGCVIGATIQNIGVENVNIKSREFAGGLIGIVSSGSTIENAYSSGKIEVTGQASGGLIGHVYKSNINNVYSTANVTSSGTQVGGLCGLLSTNSSINGAFAAGNVTCTGTESTMVGGLVGYNYNNSSISNSFATGNVKSNGDRVGGLTGQINSSTLSNCFATGNVSGVVRVGGLCGSMEVTPSISDSFATGNVNGTGSSLGFLVGYSSSNPGTTNYYANDSLINGKTSSKAVGSSPIAWTNSPVGVNRNELKDTIDWSSWDTDVWDLSVDMPTLKFDKPSATPKDENLINFQISDGYDANASIDYNCELDLNLGNLDLSTEDNARRTLTKIQELMTQVTQKQSYIGTQLNRLTGIATASQMTIENYSAAKSTVMDTDIAQETANMVKSQILQQISVSVLSQSKNITGQIAMSLIG